LLAALLFGGLEAGTSTRALDATIFPPQLASNLAVIIQGLIVLFIGAQLLLVYAWRLRRHKREPQITAPSEKVSPI
jgi:ABC-type uncharacterized transport system permease subunit